MLEALTSLAFGGLNQNVLLLKTVQGQNIKLCVHGLDCPTVGLQRLLPGTNDRALSPRAKGSSGPPKQRGVMKVCVSSCLVVCLWGGGGGDLLLRFMLALFQRKAFLSCLFSDMGVTVSLTSLRVVITLADLRSFIHNIGPYRSIR